MPLTPGTRLGPYEITSSIGAGGMGEVYKARDTRLDRTVAVKILPVSLAADPEFRQRFDREARAVSSLNHPHICTLHDVGQQDGIAYLVMEYVDGESLASRLARGPLPLDQALEYGSAIADALDRAHQHGIVHRDLKPGNVMIAKSGIKLLDFGLAKRQIDASIDAATLTKAMTAKGTLLGTIQYMAPEQLEGQESDVRSDIFAFGATLYEMLTGRRAFEGGSQASVIAAILERNPTAIGTLQPQTPAAVEHLLQKCLAKNPADRWASAHDVRLELDWARATRLVPEGTPARRRGMHPLVVAIAALGALAVGVLVDRVLTGRREVSAPNITRLSVVVPEGTVLAGRLALAMSPDGRRLAYAATRDRQRRIFLRGLDTFDEVPVPGSEDGDAPFFSPDGRWIGFIANGQAKKAPVPAGAVTTVPGISDALDATWAPDGSIVYSSRTTFGIFRLDAGGVTRPLTVPNPSRHEAAHRNPVVLPGGAWVLFSIWQGASSEKMRLAVAPIDGGREPRVVLEDGGDFPQFRAGHLLFLQATSLLRVPFDPDRLEVKGPAETVVDDLARYSRFALTAGDTLASINDADERQLQAVWMDPHGAVADTGMPRGVYMLPQLSPDNTRVALSRQVGKALELWIYDLVRGTFSRFASDGTLNHLSIWAPDGRRILYSSDRSGAANLYWQAADGSGVAERLTTSPEHHDPGSFSSDGTLVTYAAQSTATDWDIWVLPLEGAREPRAFKKTRAAEYHPMLSPDGHWLAYTSNESGTPEVYVEGFPGGGSKSQVSNNGGFSSLWSRDGRQLFYRAAGDTLMAVDVRPGPSFDAGRPRLVLTKVFGGAAGQGAPIFSLARDNRWFFLTPRETRHARIDVMQHVIR